MDQSFVKPTPPTEPPKGRRGRLQRPNSEKVIHQFKNDFERTFLSRILPYPHLNQD
jgi:hypothetical protein